MRNLKLETKGFGNVSGLIYRGIKGIRIARQSSCRKVYLCGDYVVKIEDKHTNQRLYGNYAKKQCQREWRRWNKLTPYQKRWFAPCVAYEHTKGVSVLVQKYISGHPVRKGPNLNKLEEMADIAIPKLWDVCSRNTRRTKEGRLYIIDYGV